MTQLRCLAEGGFSDGFRVFEMTRDEFVSCVLRTSELANDKVKVR